MHCYSCAEESLKPVKLTAGLSARECPRCGGVQVDLLAYRAWRDGHSAEHHARVHADGVSLVKASDNRSALACQRCSRPMLKYRIATEVENFVDLCTQCDDVWLDGGEWELLRHLDLDERLTEIMTEPWQRRIRVESAQRSAEERLRDCLGSADRARLAEIERWLVGHSARAEIMEWLQTRVHD